MYKLISIFSAIIRQYLLPNPYIHLFKEAAYADLFNVLIGGFLLYKLSFLLTRMGYRREINEPFEGSARYLFNYIILTIIITFIGKIFKDIKIMITIFIVIYIVLCILAKKIFTSNKIF